MLCEQVSPDQQRADGFSDGGSKMNAQHLVWKAAALLSPGENNTAQWAEMHAIFSTFWLLSVGEYWLMAGNMVTEKGSGEVGN